MKVALINMPSASTHRPSIGLGLLQAALQKRDITCDTYYLNLMFASMLQPGEYDLLTNVAPTTVFGGEWIFAQSLFGIDNSAEFKAVCATLPLYAEVEKRTTYADHLLTIREQVEPFLERALNEIDWASYDIIGFTSVFEQNVASLSLAKRIKERWPEKFVILGGANAEAEMGQGLLEAFPFLDAVCSGEGDNSFVQFMEGMVKTRDPRQCQTQGITMQPQYSDELRLVSASQDSQPVHDMDQLPYPNYDDYFQQFEQYGFMQTQPKARFLFESSRGCWWGAKSHCTFCGLNGSTMAYRSKSADRALDELVYLSERYQAYTNKASAVDNIIDMQYFRDFLPMIRDRKMDLDMFYETKANLTKEQVKLFREAGFYNIQPGIESLITPVLRLMKKGVSMLQNIQLLKWTQEFGVTPLWNFLYGFPGENPEDYQQVPELMEALYHLAPPSGLGLIRLDRFSPNFDHAAEYGIINIRPKTAFALSYPGLSQDLVMKVAAHFDFDYESGMQPTSYVGGVRKGISEWNKVHRDSEFFSVDLDEHLVLVDLRPLAGEDNLQSISGLEKRIYQLCDNLRSVKTILDTLNKEGISHTEAEVQAILDRLIQRKWMVTEAGVYLSLAIPLGNYAPKPKGLERMMQLMSQSSPAEVVAGQ